MQYKSALITGATDGIGKALAQKLLAQDWEVVIVGRSPPQTMWWQNGRTALLTPGQKNAPL